MSRTLIKNGYVVTVDGQRQVYPGGFVTTDGSRISAVGPSTLCPAPDGYDEVIDAAGAIVVPGLINMHQHHWYTFFKGIADGLLLEDWVSDILLPLSLNLDAPAMRLANYLAGMEMLATGTTCSLNHSVTTTTPELVAASIEPQAELGIRQVYAKELRCKTPGNPRHRLSLDEALAEFEQEAARWNGKHGGLVRFGIAIDSNAHWVAAGMSTEDLICRGYELAKRLGLKITAHISGGTFSGQRLSEIFAGDRSRRRSLSDAAWHPRPALDTDPRHSCHRARYRADGARRLQLCLHADEQSIRGGGISPFANAHRSGVNVALGTDGPMVDYSVDMVEQMKVCTLMQHVRHLDPTRMPVECSLEMATINAAKALGLENEIGSLEAGKRADIAIFDLNKPYVGVLHRPLSSFVTAGKGSDVRAVLVDGRTVYRGGVFAHLADPQAVVAEAERIGAMIMAKAGISLRSRPA